MEPIVEFSGDLPVPFKPATTEWVINMTDEERDAFYERANQRFREQHEEAKRCGVYKRCRKTDWCKVEREAKEKEEKATAARLKVLEEREEIWLRDAKQKEKEFAEYKEKTDERMSQLAELIRELILDKPKLIKSKSIKQ